MLTMLKMLVLSLSFVYVYFPKKTKLVFVYVYVSVQPIFQHSSRYLWLYALNIWRCENELVFINLVNIDLQILLGKTGLVLFSAYCLGQNTQQNTLCHFYQLSPYNHVNSTIFDILQFYLAICCGHSLSQNQLKPLTMYNVPLFND